MSYVLTYLSNLDDEPELEHMTTSEASDESRRPSAETNRPQSRDSVLQRPTSQPHRAGRFPMMHHLPTLPPTRLSGPPPVPAGQSGASGHTPPRPSSAPEPGASIARPLPFMSEFTQFKPRGTWTRFARRHLSIEALEARRIEWQLDDVVRNLTYLKHYVLPSISRGTMLTCLSNHLYRIQVM